MGKMICYSKIFPGFLLTKKKDFADCLKFTADWSMTVNFLRRPSAHNVFNTTVMLTLLYLCPCKSL